MAPALTEDFIAFNWDDSDDSSDKEAPAPTSSHAAGQPQLFTKGRKRTADEMEAESHSGYNKKQELAAKSRVTPWAAAVDWDNCRTATHMLNQEVDAFVDYISPTSEEHETRDMIVHWIRTTVVAEFPDAEVVPFGSFATKLYLPTGDIDLVVNSPSIKTGDIKSTLYRLAYILRRSNITNNIEVLAKTKVPIVKFVTSHGRFPVDISVNQPNGIRAVDVINRFLKELPAAKPLALIIKSFLNQRSMNEVFTGGLGSYSIVCMVVSFLQIHPKIRRCAIDPMENLGVLLVEFFETYGRFFSYDHVGISLRNGGHYFNKKSRGWSNPGSPGLLMIEDPQDPMNDVSGGSYGFMKVRHTLAGAFEVLSAALCLRGSALLERRYASYEERSADEMSLLGSIMGVTPETITKRKLIMELYTNRVLHRLLGFPVPPLATYGSAIKPQDRGKGRDERRSLDTSPRRRGYHTRYASRSRSRSLSPPSTNHRQRSFSPPPPPHSGGSRKQPIVLSDYMSDDSPGYAQEGERRRKRRKAQAAPGTVAAIHLDQDGDDMWIEASRGAQEVLRVDGTISISSGSSAPEDEETLSNAKADDQSAAGSEGRYAITNSRSHQRTGQNAKRNGTESGELLVTYVGDSDDSDSDSHNQAVSQPYNGSVNSTTIAETKPSPQRLEARNGGEVSPKPESLHTTKASGPKPGGLPLPPKPTQASSRNLPTRNTWPLPPKPTQAPRQSGNARRGRSPDIAASSNSAPPPEPSGMAPQLSQADKRRIFWSSKSGVSSPGSGHEDGGVEPPGNRRK